VYGKIRTKSEKTDNSSARLLFMGSSGCVSVWCEIPTGAGSSS
jgi:hypothetical protein